jgi:cytosine/adenosine deaminase-related metal-dependent hydrolase
MTTFTRKSFLGMSAGLGAFGVSGAAETRPKASPRPKTEARTLIRGADLLTMDERYKGLPRGDVLIEGDKIAAVGPDLAAAGAQVVQAADMILMPGMIDGHRHLHSDLFKRGGGEIDTGAWDAHTRRAQVWTPEALWQAQYLGGMTAIDSGVTSVVDFCHVLRSRETAEAAAAGAKASGVGGIWAPQLMPPTTFGKGDTIEVEQAWQQVFGPADPAKIKDLAAVRDKLFTGAGDVMQFGLALTAVEFAKRSPEELASDFTYAEQLQPALKVQHVLGAGGDWRMGQPKSFRVVREFYRAGLLGPGYLIAHGTGLTDDELRILSERGCSVTSTPWGETFYGNPSIHARARRAGVKTAIGADNIGRSLSNDYFQIIRAARMGLSRDERDIALSRTFSPLDYLKLATISGADAIGQGSRVGSITPGKRADLVLLRARRDFYPTDRDTAYNLFVYANIGDIDSVWVAGKLRKTAGKLIGFDWAREDEKAARLAHQLNADTASITLKGKLSGTTFPGRWD